MLWEAGEGFFVKCCHVTDTLTNWHVTIVHIDVLEFLVFLQIDEVQDIVVPWLEVDSEEPRTLVASMSPDWLYAIFYIAFFPLGVG